MISPEKFGREHGFDSTSLSWRCNGRWSATAHGEDTGEFGCATGYGDTPENAVTDLLDKIRIYRDERAAIADGDEAAKARRIEAIKAELSSLTGEAA